jgi:hypothetical protein
MALPPNTLEGDPHETEMALDERIDRSIQVPILIRNYRRRERIKLGGRPRTGRLENSVEDRSKIAAASAVMRVEAAQLGVDRPCGALITSAHW